MRGSASSTNFPFGLGSMCPCPVALELGRRAAQALPWTSPSPLGLFLCSVWVTGARRGVTGVGTRFLTFASFR